jgi:hypothetical protein
MVLLPQPEVAEDPFYELPPGLRRHPPWPMVGDIEYGHFGTHRRICRLITRPEEPGLDSLPSGSAGVPAIVLVGMRTREECRESV